MNDYFLEGRPLSIGDTVQLLVDDHIVEDRWKLERRVGEVVKHQGNPVLVQDQPWEDATGTYPCVLYDDEADRYRMWYSCFNLSNYFSHEGPGYVIAYAESEDGFDWHKPKLEGFPYGGYDKTNVVLTGRKRSWANASQVFVNPDQSEPDRRLLMTFVSREAIEMAYSPDGLRWQIEDQPLISYKSDFPNHVLWLPEEKMWYMYLRPPIRATGTMDLPEGQRHTRRRLAFAASPDLRAWSMPRTIMYPDERGQPDYDNALVFRRHGVFICLYSEMFQETGGSEVETHLATSRDGIHWERTWDRIPFIPRGEEGTYDHGQVEPGMSPPLEVGPNLLFYYYASPVGQSHWFRENAVGVCRMRKDRFIGHWAREQTGYLLTRQFILDGSKLTINCSSVPNPYMQKQAGIQVSVVEAPDFKSRETNNEKAIPGYTLDDCDMIVTDELERAVTWNGSSDLGPLQGRAVYLRFRLRDAGLFAFRVVR